MGLYKGQYCILPYCFKLFKVQPQHLASKLTEISQGETESNASVLEFNLERKVQKVEAVKADDKLDRFETLSTQMEMSRERRFCDISKAAVNLKILQITFDYSAS